MTARPAPARVDGVLVVGGGYAGVHAARAAAGLGVAVTVVDPSGDHNFVTRLAAVAGGTAPTTDASAPLAEIVERVRLGSVVDVGDGTVGLLDGTRLEADAVVVTAGAVPARPDIPGLHHALPLRTAADAFAIRTVLDDADQLVIVGGGATGVQLAGSVSTAHPDVSVDLVERDDRLLAGLDGDLGRRAADILRKRGVRLHLGADVRAVERDAVELTEGRTLDGIAVWAAGFDPRADELALPVHEDGRVLVTRELLVAGMQRTFAAGDLAHHVDADGAPHAMSAQIAVQAGQRAGSNAACVALGRSPSPAPLAHRGWVLDLGGGVGVAQIGPIRLDAPLLDRLPPVLHRVIDLKHLAEIGGVAAVRRYRPGASRQVSTSDPEEALEELSGSSVD